MKRKLHKINRIIIYRKKDEILGFKLLVITVFKAIKDPNKYEPLSPKKFFAFGKLNNKKTIRIII